MKLLSFIADGRPSYGAVKDGGVIDLNHRLPFRTLRELLQADGLTKAEAIVAVERPDYVMEAIAFAPVIPDPGKIICVGLNYRDHVAETGRTVTEKPALFARFPTSQVGHLRPIIRPRVSEHFDYEGELAAVRTYI
jgi:2-keto-4-pentenoate hydratase/2-oxohepta-3-ene-1,7-dioic acid hydratase in catechol pathway